MFYTSYLHNTEYQANLFAADLLIDDDEIEEMVQNEALDYFGLCSSLNATPELMSFKLYSLTKRGQAYHMPVSYTHLAQQFKTNAGQPRPCGF